MNKPISEKDWIGLSIAEAINKSKSIGYIHRIVEEDGNPIMHKYDVKSNRINLRLKNSMVVAAYTG